MVIGIDFDNTLVSYDEVFFKKALDLGWVPASPVLLKRQLRDYIRLLPEGELLWQQLQAYVYTQGMPQAHLIKGVKDFFSACKRARIQTNIVSHKTKHSALDPQQIDLRAVALQWMKGKGFFKPDGLGLNESQVYFEPSRAQKIERIKLLGCTHFIDDLQEVFLEEDFPQGTKKILYSPDDERPVGEGVVVVNSWEKIHGYFFN